MPRNGIVWTSTLPYVSAKTKDGLWAQRCLFLPLSDAMFSKFEHYPSINTAAPPHGLIEAFDEMLPPQKIPFLSFKCCYIFNKCFKYNFPVRPLIQPLDKVDGIMTIAIWLVPVARSATISLLCLCSCVAMGCTTSKSQVIAMANVMNMEEADPNFAPGGYQSFA
jgi:hypothetical protein